MNTVLLLAVAFAPVAAILILAALGPGRSCPAVTKKGFPCPARFYRKTRLQTHLRGHHQWKEEK